MRHLKSLDLACWSMLPDADLQSSSVDMQPLSVMKPSATLRCLSLRTIHDTDLMSYLLKPSQEYIPSTLRLSFMDTRPFGGNDNGERLSKQWDPRPFLGRLGPYITKLMLAEYSASDDITSFMKHFPALQSFCLCLNAFASLPTIPFPSSLHRLHLNFPSMHLPVGQDRTLVSSLRYSPQIRELLITYGNDWVDDDQQLEGPDFSLTAAYCRSNGIEFTMEEIEGEPSYHDL